MKHRCSIRIKFWIFKNYWWILIPSLLTLVLFLISKDVELIPIVTLTATTLSLAHFIQKQKLDEMQLLRDLFKDFNARYDRLNDKLMKLSESPKEISHEDITIIIDYFNLCGEEYFYYSKGYIDPVVWDAWYKGMQENLKSPQIKNLWRIEKMKESYYGLPL